VVGRYSGIKAVDHPTAWQRSPPSFLATRRGVEMLLKLSSFKEECHATGVTRWLMSVATQP
jgi:hypothetical protein